MPALFAAFDGIVAIVSLGAVVRLIAPHLKSKEVDPAWSCSTKPAVRHPGALRPPRRRQRARRPSRHGARRAGRADHRLGRARNDRVDLLGRELGWTFEATHDELVRCSAAVVNDEPVALVQEAGRRDWWTNHANGRKGPLPANVTRFARLEDVDLERFAAVLWISRRAMPADYAAQTGRPLRHLSPRRRA
jgi:cobalt-precorrin 5A hydrolase